MNDTIIEFINKFKSYEKDTKVLFNTFKNGYCYYFAIMLQERFGGNIFYDPVEGHFLFSYDGELYDITGNVTQLYDKSNLMNKEEWMQRDTILRGVILKLKDKVE